jgi:hypothetical protein
MQMKTSDEKLLEKDLTFSRRLVSSSLTKHDAWIAYFAVLVPAMTYTFAVTHHSANRLRKIQSSPTRSTLLKLGFNRNTAKAVAYGPSRYGPLGLRDLPVEQGIAGVTMLIRHLRARSTQGTLALIALSWWQLRLGTSKPPLEDPKFNTPYDTPHWLAAHRAFLASTDGSIHIEDLHGTNPHHKRDGDTWVPIYPIWAPPRCAS